MESLERRNLLSLTGLLAKPTFDDQYSVHADTALHAGVVNGMVFRSEDNYKAAEKDPSRTRRHHRFARRFGPSAP